MSTPTLAEPGTAVSARISAGVQMMFRCCALSSGLLQLIMYAPDAENGLLAKNSADGAISCVDRSFMNMNSVYGLNSSAISTCAMKPAL